MLQTITHICYADDDEDDHYIFSMAVRELLPAAILLDFYHCNALLHYLADESKPLPDLIFLDYNMPGSDGYQCLQRIKKVARLLSVPVIIYSTSHPPGSTELAKQFGAYRYMIKPPDYDSLKKELQRVIHDLSAELAGS